MRMNWSSNRGREGGAPFQRCFYIFLRLDVQNSSKHNTNISLSFFFSHNFSAKQDTLIRKVEAVDGPHFRRGDLRHHDMTD